MNTRRLSLLLLTVLAACVPVHSTPALTPTATPTQRPLPTPSPAPTSSPSDLYLTSEDVVLYPGPLLYSGDIVSFDVTPRNLGEIDPAELTVRILHRTSDGVEVVAEATTGHPTFDEVPRARMTWTWDTTDLEGEQFLTAWLDPENRIHEGDEDPTNNRVLLTVQLRPASERPLAEVTATWDMTTTDCCVFHYLTGTAAERDLAAIVATAEKGVDHVQSRLDYHPSKPLDIYLASRIIGHGGYVREGTTLSYLDRPYVGYDLETVIRHEATHKLDAAIAGEDSIALIREGLALWIAGGHFKPEPIPERAAALIRLGWYIPLDQVTGDFYRQQHEVAYLEGAALVAYLIETYGWDEFRRFYDSFDSAHETPAEMLDVALAATFGVGLAATEEDLLRWLQTFSPTPGQIRDLQNTVDLFNAARRYQELYDPSAHFLSGWLPNSAEARRQGIVADLLRRPRAAENVALETMLIAAQDALTAGDFIKTEAILDGVNEVLERGTFSDPLAADHLAIVRAVDAAGYEAQRIELEGESARVQAIAEWPVLEELRLTRTSVGWTLRR